MYYVAIYDRGELIEQCLVKTRARLEEMADQIREEGKEKRIAAWFVDLNLDSQIQGLPVPPSFLQ